MADLTIAFDADDTLWHNEHEFAASEQRFVELMTPWADPDTVYSTLVQHERERILSYGYGVKGFALSMIDTACKLSDDAVPASALRKIVGWADDLLRMPTVLIDGALEVMAGLSEAHPIMIITKGDLHHQLRRIEAAGIAEYCFDVEVVADKDTATYDRILRRHRIDRDRFLMVGNSMPSDVIPPVELGAAAVHIPYAVTWALEQSDAEPVANGRWHRIDTIAELPPIVQDLA